MDENISANYVCYSTAKELWDNVCQMDSDFGNQSQVYELQLLLGKIQQGDDNGTFGKTWTYSMIMNERARGF